MIPTRKRQIIKLDVEKSKSKQNPNGKRERNQNSSERVRKQERKKTRGYADFANCRLASYARGVEQRYTNKKSNMLTPLPINTRSEK